MTASTARLTRGFRWLRAGENPEMWTPSLFAAMARLARPGGTFATFTSAGFVRRGLQQAGFSVAKRKGFGHKREMLTGVLDSAPGS